MRTATCTVAMLVVAASLGAQCALVKDINARKLRAESSSPEGREHRPGLHRDGGFVRMGAFWYFRATGRLGTVLVRDLVPGLASRPLLYFESIGSKLLFSADTSTNGTDRELWVSDGTASGTKLLLDIWPGSRGGSDPSHLFRDPTGAAVYFSATEPFSGAELWKTDGTGAGTVRVKDIWAGSGSAEPRYFVALGNTTLFVATGENQGRELFKTDGTERGTVLVKDINVGPDGVYLGLGR